MMTACTVGTTPYQHQYLGDLFEEPRILGRITERLDLTSLISALKDGNMHTFLARRTCQSLSTRPTAKCPRTLPSALPASCVLHRPLLLLLAVSDPVHLSHAIFAADLS